MWFSFEFACEECHFYWEDMSHEYWSILAQIAWVRLDILSQLFERKEANESKPDHLILDENQGLTRKINKTVVKFVAPTDHPNLPKFRPPQSLNSGSIWIESSGNFGVVRLALISTNSGKWKIPKTQAVFELTLFSFQRGGRCVSGNVKVRREFDQYP